MTTTVEPEYDEQTRMAMQALDAYERGLCPLCGQPSHVCQDPVHQFDWHVPDPVRCHATTALLARQRGYTEDTNPQVQALLFGVQLRESPS